VWVVPNLPTPHATLRLRVGRHGVEVDAEAFAIVGRADVAPAAVEAYGGPALAARRPPRTGPSRWRAGRRPQARETWRLRATGSCSPPRCAVRNRTRPRGALSATAHRRAAPRIGRLPPAGVYSKCSRRNDAHCSASQRPCPARSPSASMVVLTTKPVAAPAPGPRSAGGLRPGRPLSSNLVTAVRRPCLASRRRRVRPILSTRCRRAALKPAPTRLRRRGDCRERRLGRHLPPAAAHLPAAPTCSAAAELLADITENIREPGRSATITPGCRLRGRRPAVLLDDGRVNVERRADRRPASSIRSSPRSGRPRPPGRHGSDAFGVIRRTHPSGEPTTLRYAVAGVEQRRRAGRQCRGGHEPRRWPRSAPVPRVRRLHGRKRRGGRQPGAELKGSASAATAWRWQPAAAVAHRFARDVGKPAVGSANSHHPRLGSVPWTS
jgi:hypothetical protein